MSNIIKLLHKLKLWHKHSLDARLKLLFNCDGDIIRYKIEKDLCIDEIPKFFKKFDMVEFYVEHHELCNTLLANNNSAGLFCIMFAGASIILYIVLVVLLSIEVTSDALFFSCIGGSLFGGIYGLAFMMSLLNVKCEIQLFPIRNEFHIQLKQFENTLNNLINSLK